LVLLSSLIYIHPKFRLQRFEAEFAVREIKLYMLGPLEQNFPWFVTTHRSGSQTRSSNRFKGRQSILKGCQSIPALPYSLRFVVVSNILGLHNFENILKGLRYRKVWEPLTYNNKSVKIRLMPITYVTQWCQR